jgi:hypothetical protein
MRDVVPAPDRSDPPRSTELWQRLLEELDRALDLDAWGRRAKAGTIRQLQNLYAIGERPSYEEFKAYAEALWPNSPRIRERMRGIWRTILRNPSHQFRIMEGWVSFSLLDELAKGLSREYGSHPLSWRVLGVLDRAVDEYRAAAVDDPDLERFLIAHRELRAAMGTLWRFRLSRFGAASVGSWIYADASQVTEEQMSEWARLKKKYR